MLFSASWPRRSGCLEYSASAPFVTAISYLWPSRRCTRRCTRHPCRCYHSGKVNVDSFNATGCPTPLTRGPLPRLRSEPHEFSTQDSGMYHWHVPLHRNPLFPLPQSDKIYIGYFLVSHAAKTWTKSNSFCHSRITFTQRWNFIVNTIQTNAEAITSYLPSIPAPYAHPVPEHPWGPAVVALGPITTQLDLSKPLDFSDPLIFFFFILPFHHFKCP